jgi:hypothetical protein
MSVSHNRPKLPGIEQIGRFIAVASGKGGDSGVPIVEGQPDSEPARLFADLAERLVELERQST